MCSRGGGGGALASVAVGSVSGWMGTGVWGVGCVVRDSVTSTGRCAGGAAQAHNSAARPIHKPCRIPLQRILTIRK